MKLTLIFLLFATSAFSHVHQDGYKRVQFENHHFRDYSRLELAEKIGEDQILLPSYVCNGRDELDPFHAPLRSNPAGDSLKIKGHKSEEIITYTNGEYFDKNGKKLNNLSHDTFYKYVVKALAKLEKLESTSKLLRLLEHSYFPLQLEFGGNRFIPYANKLPYKGIYIAGAISFLDTLRFTSEDAAIFNQIGTGGSIAWHPTMEIWTTEEDGKTRILDPDIALAHEMYHAFDSIRGLLDQRGVQGEGYENTNVAEYRASYFENLVRKELGLKYRKYYSAGEGKGGILDEFGEPRFISSPCLGN